MKQKTLNKSITLEGIGIHTGERAVVKLNPARENTGIILQSNIGSKTDYFPVNVDYVTDTRNHVALGKNGQSVKTVEHLLSALNSMEINNCIIEVESKEIPIFDGSALVIVEAIKKAGIKIQKADYKPLSIPHPLWVTESDRYIIIIPNDTYKVQFNIKFAHPLIGHQLFFSEVNSEVYEKEIAPARTFGFYNDWKILKDKGLSLGCSLANTLVYSDDGILNDELRFTDECVRHKVLDLIGDLSLLGTRFHGYVIANKTGHQLNVSMVKKIRETVLENPFNKREIKDINKQFEKFVQKIAVENLL